VSNVNMVLVGDAFVARPEPDSAFVTARHLLKDADVAFCNLETVVADAKYLAPHDHDHHPRTDEWMFESYLRAGFNVMNLANNPSTWHGLDPFLRCLEVLDKAGIVRGGGGRNYAEARKAAIIERQGTKIAFVCRASVCDPITAAATDDRPGIAYYPVQTFYEPRLRVHHVPGSPPIIHTIPDRGVHRAALEEDIREARKRADVVIVSWHWGVSPTTGGTGELAEYQIEMGHFAIEAGADMVAGHHSHVLQAIEVYKGKPILYSLGNFVHDLHYQKRPNHVLLAMLVRCQIHNGNLQRLSFVPGLYKGNGPPEFFQPDEAPELVKDIQKISSRFRTEFEVSEHDVAVKLDGAK
jgi:poly-gamma-glutamate capsule biosynthesis protein CapA/YwtB (metallophosphatase superfamily)